MFEGMELCFFSKTNHVVLFAQETMTKYDNLHSDLQLPFTSKLQHGGSINLDAFVERNEKLGQETPTESPRKRKKHTTRRKRKIGSRTKEQRPTESKAPQRTESKEEVPESKELATETNEETPPRPKKSGGIAYFRAENGQDPLPRGKCASRLCQIVFANTDDGDTHFYSPAWYQFVFLPYLGAFHVF